MSYEDTYLLAGNEELIRRVAVAAAEVATEVYGESIAAANYAVRRALVGHAGPRASDFRNFAEQVTLLLCSLNPTLGLSSSDAQLRTAVSNVWTPYALVLQSKGVITA